MYNNLKITLRSLVNNRIYTVINILGLVISLVSALYIFLWIDHEYSYDKFHQNGENIYHSVAYWNGSVEPGDYWGYSPIQLGEVMKESIADVESFCRIFDYRGYVDYLRNPDNGRSISRSLNIFATDPTFFDIFSFDIINGDRQTAYNDISSILISETTANILFPESDPVGKTIMDQKGRKYNVSAVFADMPDNSTINYSAIIPFSYIEKINSSDFDRWGTFNYPTYFLMRPGFDKESVDNLMTQIYREKRNITNPDEDAEITLFPLLKRHLYYNNMTPNSTLKECRLFSVIAVIILAMACINYVNLVTARSSKRIKEVSVRRILGAKKGKLFAFFYNETIVLFLLSLIISVILLLIAEPVLNQISGKVIEINPFSTHTLSIFLITFLFISIAGGVYPAFVLTNEHSFKVSSRNKERWAGNTIRQSLVVLQFAAVIALTMGTMVISRQMKFMKMKDLGYDPENVLYIRIPDQIRENLNSVTSQLNSNPNILNVATSSQRINNITSYSSKEIDEEWVKFMMFNIDHHAIESLGIEILEGENFKGIQSDNVGFIINQSAERILFPEGRSIGKKLNYNGVDGVVLALAKDFHHSDLKSLIKPMIITSYKNWRENILYLKTNGDNGSAIKTLEEIWNTYSPDIDFSYSSLKEDFDKDYMYDIRGGRLINIFSVISLIIACLGIFGLITYTAEKRSKEIGIRKVLGADVRSIVLMLSKEFMVLYFIAMVIAFPIAKIWLTGMLDQYVYHISISVWYYLLTAIVTFTIGALTICYKAIKTAMSNPVDAIRSE